MLDLKRRVFYLLVAWSMMIFAGMGWSVFCAKADPPGPYIVDEEEILLTDTRDQINLMGDALFKRTGINVAMLVHHQPWSDIDIDSKLLKEPRHNPLLESIGLYSPRVVVQTSQRPSERPMFKVNFSANLWYMAQPILGLRPPPLSPWGTLDWNASSLQSYQEALKVAQVGLDRHSLFNSRLPFRWAALIIGVTFFASLMLLVAILVAKLPHEKGRIEAFLDLFCLTVFPVALLLTLNFVLGWPEAYRTAVLYLGMDVFCTTAAYLIGLASRKQVGLLIVMLNVLLCAYACALMALSSAPFISTVRLYFVSQLVTAVALGLELALVLSSIGFAAFILFGRSRLDVNALSSSMRHYRDHLWNFLEGWSPRLQRDHTSRLARWAYEDGVPAIIMKMSRALWWTLTTCFLQVQMLLGVKSPRGMLLSPSLRAATFAMVLLPEARRLAAHGETILSSAYYDKSLEAFRALSPEERAVTILREAELESCQEAIVANKVKEEVAVGDGR